LQKFTVDIKVMVTSHTKAMRKLHAQRTDFNRILNRSASITHELHAA